MAATGLSESFRNSENTCAPTEILSVVSTITIPVGPSSRIELARAKPTATHTPSVTCEVSKTSQWISAEKVQGRKKEKGKKHVKL